MDSCVATAEARAAGLELYLLHVSYGQLTQARELRAFHAIADYFGVAGRLAIELTHFRVIGGSALTDPTIPLARGTADQAGIPASYVPFRNAGFLAAAVSWAEVIGAGSVYIGAVEEDSSGYPDCREEFIEAFNLVVRKGTKPDADIRIVAPLIHLTKAQIVQRGLALAAPLALTWSCYSGNELACGVCDSCRLRLRGFAAAGAIDPIPYRASEDRP